MTKFKDVAHLYIGCRIKCFGGRFLPNENSKDKDGNAILSAHLLADIHDRIFSIDEFKPILRSLSDMTGEEAKLFFELPVNCEILDSKIYSSCKAFNYRWVHEDSRLNISDGYSYCGQSINLKASKLECNPKQYTYLLSKHFDLFGLIESGEAIDVATLNPTT